jgi:hypothetical protein
MTGVGKIGIELENLVDWAEIFPFRAEFGVTRVRMA